MQSVDHFDHRRLDWELIPRTVSTSEIEPQRRPSKSIWVAILGLKHWPATRATFCKHSGNAGWDEEEFGDGKGRKRHSWVVAIGSGCCERTLRVHSWVLAGQRARRRRFGQRRHPTCRQRVLRLSRRRSHACLTRIVCQPLSSSRFGKRTWTYRTTRLWEAGRNSASCCGCATSRNWDQESLDHDRLGPSSAIWSKVRADQHLGFSQDQAGAANIPIELRQLGRQKADLQSDPRLEQNQRLARNARQKTRNGLQANTNCLSEQSRSRPAKNDYFEDERDPMFLLKSVFTRQNFWTHGVLGFWGFGVLSLSNTK